MENPRSAISEISQAHYRTYMRVAHACLALAVALLLAQPCFAGPQRVVSTFLCTDEYVFRLLARDRIAALSFEAGDRFPVVSTIADDVGGIRQIRPSVETVLDLKPDLVVLYEGTKPQLRAALVAIGVPVLDVPWANSLADVTKVTKALGERLGAERKAERLLDEMNLTLARVRAVRAERPVRTLLYEANGYALTAGLTHELMESAGLTDVAAASGLNRMGQVPIEDVVTNAPELLILNANAIVHDARADLVLRHPALASLRDRTLIVWRPLRALLCPGPWSADAALTFSDLARQARAPRP